MEDISFDYYVVASIDLSIHDTVYIKDLEDKLHEQARLLGLKQEDFENEYFISLEEVYGLQCLTLKVSKEYYNCLLELEPTISRSLLQANPGILTLQ